MQFGFKPKCKTTIAIFILRQLQEKFLTKRKNSYISIVDLEESFDRVRRNIVWWALGKLSIENCLVNGNFSDNFFFPCRITSEFSASSFVIYHGAGGTI